MNERQQAENLVGFSFRSLEAEEQAFVRQCVRRGILMIQDGIVILRKRT